MHNLRNEEPRATGVLASNERRYYITMMEDRETNKEELKERFREKLSNLTQIFFDPIYLNTLYLGLALPPLGFLSMILK